MFLKWTTITGFAIGFLVAWQRMWETHDMGYLVLTVVCLFLFVYALFSDDWDTDRLCEGDYLVMEEQNQHWKRIANENRIDWHFPDPPEVSR